MYSKRTRQLAALFFMCRVAERLHKELPIAGRIKDSPEYKAWAISYERVEALARDLGASSYWEVRWMVLGGSE